MNQTRPRLGYTILITDQLRELQRFYAETLGLAVVEERSGYVKLDAGAIFLSLRRPRQAYDELARGGAVQLAFPTDLSGVDRWADHLLRAGVEVLEPPTDQPWGHRTVFAADPDGNLVEFYAEI